MRGKSIDQQVMAWGLLIGLWQRRFIHAWTTDEVVNWHRRITSTRDAGEKPAPASAKGERRGRTAR